MLMNRSMLALALALFSLSSYGAADNNVSTAAVDALPQGSNASSQLAYAVNQGGQAVSAWSVKVSMKYLTASGYLKVDQPVLSVEVQEGGCGMGKSKLVPMQGQEVKVTQKICIGMIGHQMKIVGWVFTDTPSDILNPSDDTSEYERGRAVDLLTDGRYVSFDTGAYTITVNPLSQSVTHEG
ncbi:Uncharacterised protein [Pseudomonas luteola]|uniref:Lipoprotein n=2 Tax=Pseudomonas luteola TaxID=47886 RepID=A0A2X2C363_PSELU|nr:Uncharacterised protein [Pseudomonas luteola]